MASARRPRAVLAIAASVLIGLGVVVLGPWWDLGFEYAALNLCAPFLRDELEVVTAVREIVPARLGCSVDGRPRAIDGAGLVQLALLPSAAVLVVATSRGARIAAALTVSTWFVLGGWLAWQETEGVALAMGAVLLTPPLALLVAALTGRVTARTWFVLVVAAYTGCAAVLSVWAAGASGALALPVGAAVSVAFDRLGRRWLRADR